MFASDWLKDFTNNRQRTDEPSRCKCTFLVGKDEPVFADVKESDEISRCNFLAGKDEPVCNG